jgi:hypothetical protein
MRLSGGSGVWSPAFRRLGVALLEAVSQFQGNEEFEHPSALAGFSR